MLFALGNAPRLLYPFRYRDPRTGKWVRARYKAEPHVIAERHAEWEVTGPAEVHRRGECRDSFNPFRKIVTHAELARQPQPDMQPAVDATSPVVMPSGCAPAATPVLNSVTICAHAPPDNKQSDARMQPRRMRQGFIRALATCSWLLWYNLHF
jgi:hypothetical protein